MKFPPILILVIVLMPLLAPSTIASAQAPLVPESPSRLDPHAPGRTVADLFMALDRGRFFLAALESTQLLATLRLEGPFTVFAPSDDVFGLLEEAELQALRADLPRLGDLLASHVVVGFFLADDLFAVAEAGDRLESLSGASLEVVAVENDLFVNGALVTAEDVQADNGVVFFVDALLVPHGDPLAEHGTE